MARKYSTTGAAWFGFQISTAGRAIRLAVGVFALWALLVLPTRPDAFAPANILIWPVGLPVVVVILSLLRGRWFKVVLAVTGIVAAAILILKLADIGTEAAFEQPFNPLLDGWILVAGWHLLAANVGLFKAVGALVLGVVIWLGWIGLLVWGLAGLSRDRPRPQYLAAGCAVIAGIGVLALGVSNALGADWPVASRLTHSVVARIALIERDYAELAAFSQTITPDPIARIPSDKRLSALAGHNVVLIFVESYGRSALDEPRYGRIINNRLKKIDADLRAAGRHVVSGWLQSPTVGGGSWFAHGALLSGLWTNSQARYDRMIVSKRASLNRLFKRAGWRTIAVMPQITRAWPQARYFDYDEVYADGDLGYRGQSFNWITMPDQYTLAQIHRIMRDAPHAPVMLETALVSSHAPWVPVPHMVPWNTIGNGTIFNAQAKRGDPPSVVWQDPARVRRQYVKAVDYSLQAVGSYITRYGDNTVFIVLGDHQPAALITGHGVSRDVPIHIVADDPAIIRRLSGWHWTRAMRPAKAASVYRMSAFRKMFVRAMSDTARDRDSDRRQ